MRRRPWLAALIIWSIITLGLFLCSKDRGGTHRICAGIELKGVCDSTAALLNGYNYFLLEKYASDHNAELEVSISRFGKDAVDSLQSGALDILVIPYADSLRPDGVCVSIPVDSISVWVLPLHRKHRMRNLNRWIADYHSSADYDSVRTLFTHVYDPLKAAAAGKRFTDLSPYDGLIRQYADSLGWDWRLLCAIIYQESRFRIEAESHRGAKGLMQIMPGAAGDFNAGNLYDPEENIRTGTRILGRLYPRYRRVAKNHTERIWYTLAAYNAGAGRMSDIIGYANTKGIDVGSWEDLAAIIPEMRDPVLMSAADTVKLGVFNGTETLNYISRISSLYEAFKQISPNQ